MGHFVKQFSPNNKNVENEKDIVILCCFVCITLSARLRISYWKCIFFLWHCILLKLLLSNLYREHCSNIYCKVSVWIADTRSNVFCKYHDDEEQVNLSVFVFFDQVDEELWKVREKQMNFNLLIDSLSRWAEHWQWCDDVDDSVVVDVVNIQKKRRSAISNRQQSRENVCREV